jgi:hypothetical protein
MTRTEVRVTCCADGRCAPGRVRLGEIAALTTTDTIASDDASNSPEDALSVAAPANPPTRHTERLSPQQMWVCGPSGARQVIRHKALLPPDFGFTACILGCGGGTTLTH